MFDIEEAFKRATVLLSTGNTKEQAAPKLSAEFHGTAYVSKGKLWMNYINGQGKPTASVLA